MKIREILLEVPAMVPYPEQFKGVAERLLAAASARGPDDYTLEYQDGALRIVSTENDNLLLFIGDTAVGMMEIWKNENISGVLGKTAWQVANVYILPEHRNKKLGLMLYHHIIFHRNEAFASGAAMTPDSRRVYTSMWKDPRIDVFAFVYHMRARQDNEPKRQELHIGPEGITTGDDELDHEAVFVATARQ